MAAEQGPSSGEYIIHHLTHLQNHKASNVVDFPAHNYHPILFPGTAGLFGSRLD